MTDTSLTSLIELRSKEVAQYQANIVMFESILSTLPTEWPEHLLQYRNATSHHDTIELVEDLNDVELLSKLWYADQCRRAIRTETVEMTKSKSILAALEAQIGL